MRIKERGTTVRAVTFGDNFAQISRNAERIPRHLACKLIPQYTMQSRNLERMDSDSLQIAQTVGCCYKYEDDQLNYI